MNNTNNQAAEAAVKAGYVAGTVERTTYQDTLAMIHAEKAEARGFGQCGCNACREARARKASEVAK